MLTGYLCTSLGYSKQAYYKSLRSSNEEEGRERYILSIVEEIRRDLPRLGVFKLWKMLNANGLIVGRDWLFRLLQRHDLLVKMKKYRVVTTDSRAWRRQYPNLVKGLRVERANQVWVSDITYLPTGKGFVYLSLVTDVYSRRIMGWEVHPTLDSSGPVKALYRALENGDVDTRQGLIHHSDRGGQYCSSVYTGILKLHRVGISMTQDGSPYDNAITERVNGILKREWLNDIHLKDIDDASKHVGRVIRLYNEKRPHLAVRGLVPERAYKDKSKKFARVMF